MLKLSDHRINAQNLTNTSGRVFFVGALNETTDALLKLLLEQEFKVAAETRFSDALDLIYEFLPDVIILDTCSSELMALELCISIKSISRLKKSVVMFLSDRNDELMEMTAYNSGADDFVIYPIRINALVSRIRIRLNKSDQSITVIRGKDDKSPLKIDRESFSVSIGNQFIQLSKKEFEILFLLAGNPEKVFRREDLIQSVWNKKRTGKNRTLDVHISRLRHKLGNRFISSQKGIGYRFNLY